MRRTTRLPCIVLVFLAATLAALPASRAQTSAPTMLTGQRLTTFAQVVRGSPDAVAFRLLNQPSMLGLADQALHARARRLDQGTALTILGGSLMVVAVVALVGGLALWDTFDPSECSSEDQSRCGQGLHLAIIGLGLTGATGGVVLGAIGLYKLGVPSDAELRARQAYAAGTIGRPAEVPRPARSDRDSSFMGPQGRAFRIPLLSLGF